jgi:hypothetical protein
VGFLVALVALPPMLVACSGSTDTSGPDVSNLNLSVPASQRAQGDECNDPTGDLQSDVKGGQNQSEPAGIDLVHSKAKVEGDNLDVSIQTAGPIESATNPLFVVQQGDTSSVVAMDQSFELRAARDGQGPWTLNLITFANNRERPAQPLSVPVDVQGNQLSYSIPLKSLPQIATIVWQFGSSSGVSDDSRVIDECEPFNQGSTGSTVVGATGATTPSATGESAVVTGNLGQAVVAPDGSKVTVKGVANPANINRTVLVHPIPTDQLAAVQVEVCAGDTGAVEGVADKRFTVQTADGRSFDVWPPDYATDPQFTAGQTLRPGECTADGWITYEIPRDASVIQVTYDAGGKNVGPYVRINTA